MKLSERLQKRLADDLNLFVVDIRRIRRGRHGKSAGAWAWRGVIAGTQTEVGSEDTMYECVMAPKISSREPIMTWWNQILIDAERPTRKVE